MTEKTSKNACGVCGKAARQLCSSCKSVFYCSRDCQKQDWKAHKTRCRSYTLETNHVYGRYIVATREIKAGEIVFKDTPLIIGPKQRTVPLCLGCHKLIKMAHKCQGCNFPLCSAACENSMYHKDECKIIASGGNKLSIKDFSSPHPVYEFVSPLRCLLLKERDRKKWETLSDLESHLADVMGTEIYKVNQRNTVDFIRKFIGWHGASEEDIHRVCCILNTNSFELRHNGQKIRGLYPVGAMMAHSCTPNTKHVFEDSQTMVVRATVSIPKGEAITTTYSQTLWNTLSRREHLQLTKNFWCGCARCSDPTELGTNLSTLMCSECEGNIMSGNPLNADAEWACNKCEHTVMGKSVKWGDSALYKELRELDQSTAKPLEEFLVKYQKALHSGHRFFVEAKYALIKYYGNHPGYQYRDLTQKQLEDKVKWCRELLEVADKIDPGLSLLRGSVLFELQAGIMALAKHLLSNDLITEKEAQDYMNEAVIIVKEASEILKQEPEMENGGLDGRLKDLTEQLDM